ncbi:MAG: type III pantothenate kinase [Edaphocola sp.]
MNLCIDWGNTRVKTALFENDTIVKEKNFSEEDALPGIMDLVGEHKPEAAILCAVANHPPELKHLLQERTKLLMLTSSTKLPILNAYHSPDSLGADRIALAVAAHEIYPEYDNLVVSLGSAITYNFLPRNRAFRGGSISPGLDMRFRALHQFTDKLPLVSEKGELVIPGYDTETSIRSGVVMGIGAEIDGMVNFYKEQFPGLNVLLTGGNAHLFADKLKNKVTTDARLLLKGLQAILKFNY